jgi:hypothetical protein
MLKTSSISTGSGRAFACGIVSPAASVCLERPGVTWTYLRPRAERGRMMIVESLLSGSTVRSSFRPMIAESFPSSVRSGLMLLTTPTRSPPTRTSLPITRPAEFGTRAFTS